MVCGASMPFCRNASRNSAHCASTSPRTSGQSYIGNAAISSLIPTLNHHAWRKDRKNAASNQNWPTRDPGMPELFLGRLGGHRRGAEPTDVSRPDARLERPAVLWCAPQRRMHDRLLRLEGIGFDQREIVRIGIAIVHSQPLVTALAKQLGQPVPG